MLCPRCSAHFELGVCPQCGRHRQWRQEEPDLSRFAVGGKVELHSQAITVTRTEPSKTFFTDSEGNLYRYVKFQDTATYVKPGDLITDPVVGVATQILSNGDAVVQYRGQCNVKVGTSSGFAPTSMDIDPIDLPSIKTVTDAMRGSGVKIPTATSAALEAEHTKALFTKEMIDLLWEESSAPAVSGIRHVIEDAPKASLDPWNVVYACAGCGKPTNGNYCLVCTTLPLDGRCQDPKHPKIVSHPGSVEEGSEEDQMFWLATGLWRCFCCADTEFVLSRFKPS